MVNPKVEGFLQAMNIGPETPLAEVLDIFIGQLKESDFIFTRKY